MIVPPDFLDDIMVWGINEGAFVPYTEGRLTPVCYGGHYRNVCPTPYVCFHKDSRRGSVDQTLINRAFEACVAKYGAANGHLVETEAFIGG